MVGKESDAHNWNPRRMEMERNLTVTCGRKRKRPKSKTLASNLPKIPIQSLQSVQNVLKSVFRSQNQRNLEEMEENCAEIEARESH